jgi:hypothetical protein
VTTLLYYATKWAALIGVVCVGLLGLTAVAAAGLLPDDLWGALAIGYLSYAVFSGAATMALLGYHLLTDPDPLV